MAYADTALSTTTLQPATKSAWEYRVWTDTMPEALKDEWTEEEIRTDTYFLSPLTRWLLKIRGGERLELKVNLETRDRMEHWTTQLSSAFPLTPRTVHEATSLHLSEYACQKPDRLTTFVDLCTNFDVVDVHKYRRLTTIGSTQVEWTQAQIAGQLLHTVAFEAKDIEELKKIVKLMDLGDHTNCDYGRLLRSML